MQSAGSRGHAAEPRPSGHNPPPCPRHVVRVRMPLSCLVRFCNVSKGRPIPLAADPGRPRGSPGATPAQPRRSPPQKIRPPLGAQNRYKTSQDDQDLAYKVSKTVQQGQDDVQEAAKTVKDGSRGVQHCQRWFKRPPSWPKRLPKRLHTSPGRPKSLKKQ